MIADVLPELWKMDAQLATGRLDELRELARGALAEMRTLLLELRPAVLIEAALDELLQQLINATIARARIEGELHIEGNINDLPQETHVAIYRTTQEALNNVAKHAEASKVVVAIHRNAELLTLSISDDGRGFDGSTQRGGHFGLGNMRERIETVGGTISMQSNPGEGTSVFVQIERNALGH